MHECDGVVKAHARGCVQAEKYRSCMRRNRQKYESAFAGYRAI